MIFEIKSQEDWDSKVVGTLKTVVVCFTASWCGPCKAMAPTLEKVADDLVSVNFVKVDIEQDWVMDITTNLNVMAIPTLVRMEKGEGLNKIVGGLSYDQIKNFALGIMGGSSISE